MIKKRKKLTEKTWFIVTMLLFFTPVGLFFMWRSKSMKKKTKKRITLVYIMIQVVAFIANVLINLDEKETNK